MDTKPSLLTSISITLLMPAALTACGTDAAESKDTAVRQSGEVVQQDKQQEDPAAPRNPVNGEESSQAKVEKFLKSEEGQAVQETASIFSEAYLTGDRSIVEQQVTDPKEAERQALQDPYDKKEVALRVLKVAPDGIRPDSVSAQYEVQIAGDPAFRYVDLQLVKQAEGWKVQSYGLES